MIIFIFILAFMTVLVLGFLAYPLFYFKTTGKVSFEESNIEIYLQKIKHLESELKIGMISQKDFIESQNELKIRLLNDIESGNNKINRSSFLWPKKYTFFLLIFIIPVSATIIYMQLGKPAVIKQKNAVKPNSQQVIRMVDELATRLKANPDNPKAWLVLARSYKVMGRLEDAEQAFKNVGQYLHSDPEALVDYAVLLGLMNNDIFNQQAINMIDEALQLNPDHINALMLSGVVAYQQANYEKASQQWQKLYAMLDPKSDGAKQIQLSIDDARQKARVAKQTSEKIKP